MSQLGYGVNDPVGAAFQFLSGATAIVTGTTIQMTAAALVLNPAGTIAALTVTLPANAPEGTVAEISSTQILTSLTVNAATAYAATGTAITSTVTVSDVIVNGVLGAVTNLTPAASTGGSATDVIRYKYTLNGYQPNASVAALNPRTWFRVS
jgi:hypothetical protein